MNLNHIQKPDRIFVIGFMGSNRIGKAAELADKFGYRLMDMDTEIVARDGRSIKRLCMTMGEHEYRNKEYELLLELSKEDGIVAACGEGVVLDDMNLETLKANPVVFADAPLDELWAIAKEDFEIPYAFMSGARDEQAKEKFCELYETRLRLYNQCIE